MATGGPSDDQQMRAVKNYVTQMLGDPEETRKLLVQNIAQNIFENLKKNSDMKDILKNLLATEDKLIKRFNQKFLDLKLKWNAKTRTLKIWMYCCLDFRR